MHIIQWSEIHILLSEMIQHHLIVIRTYMRKYEKSKVLYEACMTYTTVTVHEVIDLPS